MEKLDLKKAWRQFYQVPKGRIVDVEVPAFPFLRIDGEGDPNTAPAYREAVEALYQVSYALKFKIKKGPEAVDYAVMPLEGLWWADDMTTFSVADKSNWKWTLMILQLPYVKPPLVTATLAEVKARKDPPALDRLRFESFQEGTAAQVLHIGPFTEEGPTIARLHAHIAASGRRLAGKHHEIYLSDIRRADPAKWRTIIRQPFV